MRQIKAAIIEVAIIKVDKEQRLAKCSEKASLIVDVAKSVGWSRLWDLTSELGLKTVSGLQMVSRALGHHGDRTVPMPLVQCWNSAIRFIDHILEKHRKRATSTEGWCC